MTVSPALHPDPASRVGTCSTPWSGWLARRSVLTRHRLAVGGLVAAGLAVSTHPATITVFDFMYCGLSTLVGVTLLAVVRSQAHPTERGGDRVIAGVAFAAAVLVPFVLTLVVIVGLQRVVRRRIDTPLLAGVVAVHTVRAVSPWAEFVHHDPSPWESTPWIAAHLMLCLAAFLTVDMAGHAVTLPETNIGSAAMRAFGGMLATIAITAQQTAPVVVGTLITTGSVCVLHRVVRDWETAVSEARRDATTGLANRAGMHAAADTDTGCVLMLDLDRFKHVNDTYGHPVGDRVLRDVGDTLREHLRKGDVLARWGGEEFCIVLPGTDRGEAGRLAERLRAAVAAQPATAARPAITVSVGVSVVDTPRASLDQRIADADRALYAAKRAGRNCVR